MVVSSLALGLKTKCMVRVSSHGRMAELTKVSMLMTRKKAMAFSSGPMVANTTAFGRTVSNMDRVNTFLVRVSSNMACGSKVKENAGSTIMSSPNSSSIRITKKSDTII